MPNRNRIHGQLCPSHLDLVGQEGHDVTRLQPRGFLPWGPCRKRRNHEFQLANRQAPSPSGRCRADGRRRASCSPPVRAARRLPHRQPAPLRPQLRRRRRLRPPQRLQPASAATGSGAAPAPQARPAPTTRSTCATKGKTVTMFGSILPPGVGLAEQVVGGVRSAPASRSSTRARTTSSPSCPCGSRAATRLTWRSSRSPACCTQMVETGASRPRRPASSPTRTSTGTRPGSLRHGQRHVLRRAA